MKHALKIITAGLLLGVHVLAPMHEARADDLVFGMSTALTGPSKDLGLEMQRGIETAFERTNARGGIRGNRLKLLPLDDGYEPARTGPNMHALVDNPEVLGIIGNVGTPTAIVAVPIAEAAKTLFFAPFTGAGMLRPTPVRRYVINYRASYAEEISFSIDGLINEFHFKPEDIAFFTQRDGYGDAGFAGGLAALKRHGLKDPSHVLHVQYERNTEAVENAVADIAGASVTPKAIVMVGVYAPCAKFIRLAAEVGIKAVFVNVSFVGSESLAEKLTSTTQRVYVTQVVPPADSNARVVSEFLADLVAQGKEGRFGFGAVEGYIAGRILSTALERTTGTPTRETVVDALEGLGEFDLGTGAPLQLSSAEHQASHFVWLTKISNGKVLSTNWPSEIDHKVSDKKA